MAYKDRVKNNKMLNEKDFSYIMTKVTVLPCQFMQ